MSNRHQRRRQKNNKYQQSTITETSVRTFFVRFIAVWIFILPLIVHVKEVNIPVAMQDLYLQEKTIDLFAYWKAVWLITGATILFISALIFRHVYKIGYKLNKQTGLLLAFSGTIILSFIFSEHKDVALFGYIDRFEGTLSWLSYCMAGYAVHTFTNSKEHNTTIIKGIVLSAGIVGLIGAFQFFGMDFFQTDFAKSLMLGAGNTGDFTFKMPEGTSYSTLYNPNYVGSFVAITLPLVAYMIKEAKNHMWRTLYVAIALLLIVSLIGSKSTAGLVAVVIVFVVGMVWFVVKSNIKNIHKASAAVVVLVALFAGLMLPYTQTQLNKLKNSFSQDPNPNHFKSVEVVGKDVVVTTDTNHSFTISPLEDIVEVKDQAGNILQGEAREKDYIIRHPNLSKGSYIRLFYETRIVDIVYYTNYEEGKYSRIRFDYFPQLGEFTILKRSLAENNGDFIKMFKNEKSLSKRGYIWNHTLPKIIKSPLIGYGADTFALNYPQVDLLNKWYNMYYHRIVVDKVHNTYLQIAINFGLLSLLLFVIITVTNSMKSWQSILITLGYMVTALINDSIMATTTLLFIIMFLSHNEIRKNRVDPLR